MSPDLAEAYSTLAMISLFVDHDPDAALGQWRQAIALDPGNMRARCEYALSALSTVAGDNDEAVRQTQKRSSADGLNVWAWSMHAFTNSIAGRIEESLAAAQHAPTLARRGAVERPPMSDKCQPPSRGAGRQGRSARVGTAVGAAIDQTAMGVAFGAALGTALGSIFSAKCN